MTATALELKKKLDNTIPYLSEKQLYMIFAIAEAFALSQQQEAQKQEEKLPPKNPKFGGRRISPELAEIFITGNSLDVTDEELDEMKYEYLTEKYK